MTTYTKGKPQPDGNRFPGYGIEADLCAVLSEHLRDVDEEDEPVFFKSDSKEAADEVLKMLRDKGYLREGL